jgi:hypothetical protein
VPASVPLLSTALPDGVSAGFSNGFSAGFSAGASASTGTGLPVLPALGSLLPGGLPRGQTVTVGGSLSLLLALLAGPSADGAWCALVDLPSRAAVNAEALAGLGLALDRVVVVRAPAAGWSRAGWVTTVGALVDAFDVVAVRPEMRPETRPAPGDVHRLAARVRSHRTVLVPYLAAGQSWPGAAVRLRAAEAVWSGVDTEGGGRLRQRRVTVVADRRGQEARPCTGTLWLPTADGGVVRDDGTESSSSASSTDSGARAPLGAVG